MNYVGRSPWTALGPLTRPNPTPRSGCGSGEPPHTARCFKLFAVFIFACAFQLARAATDPQLAKLEREIERVSRIAGGAVPSLRSAP